MSDVLVLCYHAVSERWSADLSVTPKRLRDQLRLLLASGYRATTFHAAVTSPPARKTLAITFDDAFRSVLDLAYPILSELDVPGTVFVPTAFPDEDRALAWPGIDHWAAGPHAAELAALSWRDLRWLADRGWEIGSHTRSHPYLTQLDDATLSEELQESRKVCGREVGRSCISVAYPYGDVDARVVDAARTAGYQTGGTLPSRLYRGRPLSWPRIGVYRGDDLRRFRLKTSAVVRGLRTVVDGRRGEPTSATGRRPQTRSREG